MEYVFIESMNGIGKNSNKPYHLIKLACPKTFQNHMLSYDPAYISPDSIAFRSGDKVTVDGVLSTPYNNTQFVLTSIKKAV